MKKINSSFYLLVAMLVLASCSNDSGYKKTKSGLMYKFFSDSKDSAAKDGNIIKLNYSVKVGSTDSVLQASYGKMPGYARVEMGANGSYAPAEIFNMFHKGDSAVVIQLIDSLIKKNPGGTLPPFLKKGDKIVTTFKVLDIFKSDSAATVDRTAEIKKETARMEKEMDESLIKENKEMESYLSDKKIAAQKTGKGTFVEIKDPGTGMQADSGKYVTVRYIGKTLKDGKVFESTMDPKAQGYTFMIGARQAIPGWDEGLRLFKKGGTGTLYVPGSLAYGKNPPPGSPFKVNEPLVFDIQVVDVSDTQPAPQQQQLPPQLREQLLKAQQQQQQKPQKGNH